MALAHCELPWEILVTIFLRLPIKSVGRAKCTCKFWYTIITDPKFVEMHFNRAVENPGCVYGFDDSNPDLYFMERIPGGGTEATRIYSGLLLPKDVRTSGGLMAFFNGDEDCFNICNPITREQIKMPMSPYFARDFVITWWGFGYSSTTKEHKILVFGSATPETRLSPKVAIYTLGSESWRDIPHVPFCPPYCSSECVDCGGSLFWLMSQPDLDNCLDTIGSFEIGSEKFRGWRGPFSEMGNELKLRGIQIGLFLINLGDTLFCVRRENIHFTIWVLRNKVSESWIKESEFRSITSISFGLVHPIGFWMDRDLLAYSYVSKYCLSSLKKPRAAGERGGRWITFDSKCGEFRDLEVPFNAYPDGSPREPDGTMLSHVGSLISPTHIAALDA